MEDIFKNLANLSPKKRELVELMLRERGIDLSKTAILPQKRTTNRFPASFAQQRLWFLDQLDPGSPLYIIPSGIRLHGDFSAKALEWALNEVIRRHEVLRTTFESEDGGAVQIIAPKLSLKIEIRRFQISSDEQKEKIIQEAALEETCRPFDLKNGPLLRMILLELDAQDRVLLLPMHHIISDNWSTGVFIHEMLAFYQTFTSNKSFPLPELTIQYADFSVWQRNWLQGAELERQVSFWKTKLAGCSGVLELVTDKPRPAVQSNKGAFLLFAIPHDISIALKQLGRSEDATLFQVLMAAFQVLLYRYSGQNDINVGTPIANRNRAEIETLIGFFINTLVIRGDLSGNPTFRQLLGQIKEFTLEAYAHQDLPFEILVDELKLQRDMSHTALFQTMLVLNNAPVEALELPGLVIEPLNIDNGTTKFDLVMNVIEEKDGLKGKFEYNIDLFETESIERFINHFKTLLVEIIKAPESRIDDLSFLHEMEMQKLLTEWQSGYTMNVTGKCIHHAFEEQVKHSPNAVAVRSEEKQYTYRELNERANRLARFLKRSGLKSETAAAVFCERSIEVVTAILAIFKAGGVYVPLDPAYPRERVEFILRDAAVSVVLTQKKLQKYLPTLDNKNNDVPTESSPDSLANPKTICLDADWHLITQESTGNPQAEIFPENLAYIIYTSGSTGIPKGVQIEHGVALNHLLGAAGHFGYTPDDRVLNFAAFNFDASLEQILAPLLCGAQLVVRGENIWPPSDFHNMVKKYGLTVINPPTVYWQQLAQEWFDHPELIPQNQLKLAIAGGDTMTPDALKNWQNTSLKSVRLLNAYGPTETTITAATFDVPADFSAKGNRRLPIGRALKNRRIYILDKKGRPAPIGIPGELHLGGAGIARGYLNRPDLTAERFIPDVFSNNDGDRLYRSGDLARWLPDGTIDFLGRVDQQVKIRGFRIELGEVENALREHPDIREVVVVLREIKISRGTAGVEKEHKSVQTSLNESAKQEDMKLLRIEKRLVAYLVSRGEEKPDLQSLRAFLKDKLPDYMIPPVMVFLDEMPLMPNGKINRRMLPELEMNRDELRTAYVAPRGPVEEKIADIVADVLGLEKVGIKDNFFELGGHSMLAMQVITRVRDIFQVDIPLRSLFESPTVEGLASVITQSEASLHSEDDLDELLSELDSLSDDEVRKLLDEE